MRITKLRRERGHWEANVSIDGATIAVTRRFGSWGTVPDKTGAWREIRRDIAIALAEKVRPIEKAEKKATA